MVRMLVICGLLAAGLPVFGAGTEFAEQFSGNVNVPGR